MALYVFFNLFSYSIQGRLKKRVPSFYDCFFNFSFSFDVELDIEWKAVVWFDAFADCEDVGYVVNDVDRI